MANEREKSLSGYWRFDRSDDRVMELVSVLQGSNNLIGLMGSELKVTWSGGDVSYTDLVKKYVALDYGPLAGRPCPYPGGPVDEVIGYAAHEGGHCLWSDPGKVNEITALLNHSGLPKNLAKAWASQKDETLAEICRVQNILEDAYVDTHVGEKWEVLGEYIRIARSKLAAKRPLDMDAIANQARPGRNAMMNLWIGVSLYGMPLPQVMTTRVRKGMEYLLGRTVEAIREDYAGTRHRIAVETAIYLWREFTEDMAPLPQTGTGTITVKVKGQGQSGGKAEADEGEDDAEGDDGEAKNEAEAPVAQGGDGAGKVGNLDDFDTREVVQIPQDILEQILDAIAHEAEDLSQSVAEALSLDPRQVASQVRKGDYNAETAREAADRVKSQVAEISRVFDREQQVKSRQLHGQPRGKLDERRLARVGGGDMNVFRRREVLGRPDLAVALLLDVSGSMMGSMGLVEDAAAVFAGGLVRKQGVNFLALTYTGGFAKVDLTRICDRQMGKLYLDNIAQGGGTPTGPAIAGTQALLSRMPERDKMIVHFTDGQPDNRDLVVQAVKKCREAGVRVYTIGLAGNGPSLDNQYGQGNWETITSVKELPQAVGKLVKRLG